MLFFKLLSSRKIFLSYVLVPDLLLFKVILKIFSDVSLLLQSVFLSLLYFSYQIL